MSTPNSHESVGAVASSVEPIGYKLDVPGGNDMLAKCALAALRQIEKKGGSAAFEAWLKETDNGRKKYPLPSHAERALASNQPTSRFTLQTSFDGVVVNIYSMVAYTYISVDVMGTGVSGSGGAWGIGLGAMWGGGTLITKGDQDIQAWSQQVTFFGIVAGGDTVGGAMVQFNSDSDTIGELLVAGTGLIGAVGFGGEFQFHH